MGIIPFWMKSMVELQCKNSLNQVRDQAMDPIAEKPLFIFAEDVPVVAAGNISASL